MSYTALIFFKDGIANESVEFRNAWGGAARIWDSLFTKYIPKTHEYDNWLQAAQDGRLWKLGTDERLADCERECYYFCCDNALVRKEHFADMAKHLRDFAALHPKEGMVDHLIGFAEWFEKSDDEAIGLHATSVCENPWFGWNEETDESEPYNIATGDKHWFLFDRPPNEP